MAVASNTFLIPHSLRKGLTQSNTDILYRVMGINLKITTGLDLEINQAVTRNLIQHVL